MQVILDILYSSIMISSHHLILAPVKRMKLLTIRGTTRYKLYNCGGVPEGSVLS